MTDPDRHIPFDRVFNFRDLGGYRVRDGRTVRWRRLFRSGELQRMTAEEAARARAELGIVTVIDLRTPEEADDPRGFGPLLDPPVVRHALGMGDPRAKYRAQESGTWRPRFTNMLDQGAEQWAGAVRLLAEPEAYPALFQCVTGKDRTGVLAALLLDLLGADEETIVADYAQSEEHMQRLIRQLRERGVLGPDERPNPALAVVPEAMREMIEALRERYGGARGFLGAQGVPAADLDRVADRLLE